MRKTSVQVHIYLDSFYLKEPKSLNVIYLGSKRSKQNIWDQIYKSLKMFGTLSTNLSEYLEVPF